MFCLSRHFPWQAFPSPRVFGAEAPERTALKTHTHSAGQWTGTFWMDLTVDKQPRPCSVLLSHSRNITRHIKHKNSDTHTHSAQLRGFHSLKLPLFYDRQTVLWANTLISLQSNTAVGCVERKHAPTYPKTASSADYLLLVRRVSGVTSTPGNQKEILCCFVLLFGSS